MFSFDFFASTGWCQCSKTWRLSKGFGETDSISAFASWFWNNTVYSLNLQNADTTMMTKENEHEVNIKR